MKIFTHDDVNVKAIRARLEREDSFATSPEQADLCIDTPREIPSELLGILEGEERGNRFATRLFQECDYTSMRWMGVHTDTMMNFGMGAELFSGSCIVPVSSWKHDGRFERLRGYLTSEGVRNFVTLEFHGPHVVRGWIGAPYLSLYALLAGYGDTPIVDVFCDFNLTTKCFACSTLLSRYPFPCKKVSEPISFNLGEFLWPFVRNQNGTVRTESTLLGVVTATSNVSLDEVGRNTTKVICDLKVRELQARTDIPKYLVKKLGIGVKIGEFEPLIAF